MEAPPKEELGNRKLDLQNVNMLSGLPEPSVVGRWKAQLCAKCFYCEEKNPTKQKTAWDNNGIALDSAGVALCSPPEKEVNK